MNTISNYNQLLAEGNLGSENVDFFDHNGQLIQYSPALNTLAFIDQDTFESFPTYGAVANSVERDRRIAGAYGPVYDGDCNWINPVNNFHVYPENKFYYLQDHVNSTFIRGLTFFTHTRPAVYYQYYNASFSNDNNSIYRVDILGNEYPYSHGGVKTDIIIQQFSNYRVSDKLYLSFDQAVGGHGYHSEYQMRIPITLMLFNDKLVVPSPPVVEPPVVDPPVEDPPIIPPPVIIPTSPYSNFGGDTTDTGPTPNIDIPINPYFQRDNPRYVYEYFPSLGRWKNIFRWY